MNKNILGGGVIILVLALTAYFALSVRQEKAILSGMENQPPTTSESTAPDLPVEPAAVAARKHLAAKLSVPETSIVILQIQEETWNNGCLGLGGQEEICAMAIVPGFQVEMQVKNEIYTYRTDKVGANVRFEAKRDSSSTVI